MIRSHLLFVTSSLCVGGAERHTVALANGIDATRFRASLFYIKPTHTLLPLVDQERVSVTCGHGRDVFDPRVVGQIAKYLHSAHVDVVVATDPYSLLYVWLARIQAHCKVRLAFIFHTTILRSRKEKLQMLLYRTLARTCDRLVFVCENQRRYWEMRGLRGQQSLVIHNGIDVEHFTNSYSNAEALQQRADLGLRATDYVLGMCAALRPEKAHDDVLQALAALVKRGVDAKAVFIGDGAERAAIEMCIRALSLQDRVTITGLQADVRPYVALCDVMVLASHTIETFSIAALESMALGKPLVLSNVGGASEQVIPGVNGFLFAPGDIDALTSSLQTLADPALRGEMGRRAAALVRERFTSQRMLQAYSTLFAELADQHSAYGPTTIASHRRFRDSRPRA